MSRLVIISNRLPITIDNKEGELIYHPSAGGLATGLNSLDQSQQKVWIGWPGRAIKKRQMDEVTQELAKKDLIPVFLSSKEIERYYEGFSNKSIWPHFHYFTQYTIYDSEYWKAYQKVNQKFADIVIQELRPDDRVWVHDYQLMLLPHLIRQVFPDISIGFFLHIPFPSYEIFRILPWRAELLTGVLGADQIGFHTYDYMRHFLSAAYRITGFEHHFGKLTVGHRLVNVDVFPMGIDYDKYAYPERLVGGDSIRKRIDRFKSKSRQLIISIDRLDYTKGIPQRIRAFEKFIAQNPQYHGKVTLMLIVVPSRSNVEQYRELKDEIDTLVGRIDGEYRTFGWSPIQYFFRSFPFADLCALYKAAEIAMITPLRDGMNLVAKEFVASKEESQRGVLILSEMAGAANELTDALIINPQDIDDIVGALHQALEMPAQEQAERLRKMQKSIKKYNVKRWAENFINQQIEMEANKQSRQTNLLQPQTTQALVRAYQTAERRLILLDYDGTLVRFHPDPQEARPDEALIDILHRLRADARNKLVFISGRDKQTMNQWLGALESEMAAEHGVWSNYGQGWQTDASLNSNWKGDIRPVLESMVERTPGSFIEEKEYSIVWHYRNIDKALGEKRIREFRDTLLYLTANLDLQVLEGNKVVEIKNAGVNKGKAALHWINESDWDFILAIGDDNTDEDTFKVLPSHAYSIKVGLGQTAARYNLLGVEKVRELLSHLGQSSTKIEIL
ncbi:MAG: bifunctional alpha,alpha-trehalose-phosphate synthase (UDP-forming)/trehalose-phosphatase [Bacteroidota bacterium]